MLNATTPRELEHWLKAKNFEIQKLEDDGEESDDRTVAIYRNVVKLEIRPEEILYEVNVHAIDDPSDSVEEISHNPMETIAEFVEGDLPGSILTSSVKPADVSKLLKHIASRISTESQLRPTRKIIRRLAALISSLALKEDLKIKIAQGPTEFEKTTIGNLKKKMKEKGWNVMEPEEGKLLVNVGDQFEGEIIVDTILWDYSIEVIGNKKLKESVKTDDPISAIKKFMTGTEVNEIVKEAKFEKEETEKKKKEEAPRAETLRTKS
jgi:hypothetical protein